MQHFKGIKRYHVMGGKAVGDITLDKLPWLNWEKQIKAIHGLLGNSTHRIVLVNEVRGMLHSEFEFFTDKKAIQKQPHSST